MTAFYITKGAQRYSNKAFWKTNAFIKHFIVYLISEFKSISFMQTHWKVLPLGTFSAVRFVFIANRRSKRRSPPYSLSEVKLYGLDSCQGKALRVSCRFS